MRQSHYQQGALYHFVTNVVEMYVPWHLVHISSTFHQTLGIPEGRSEEVINVGSPQFDISVSSTEGLPTKPVSRKSTVSVYVSDVGESKSREYGWREERVESKSVNLDETTDWLSGSSQGAIPAEHTWMWPITTVSLFIYRIPNFLMTFPLDFLPLFLGISYSKRVSRTDPMRDPFITPLHISSALGWGTHSQGSRGKREVDEKKKIFYDNKITMSMRKMMGCIIHHLLTKYKHCIIFRHHRIKIDTSV